MKHERPTTNCSNKSKKQVHLRKGSKCLADHDPVTSAQLIPIAVNTKSTTASVNEQHKVSPIRSTFLFPFPETRTS
jgi:hypothetical protein